MYVACSLKKEFILANKREANIDSKGKHAKQLKGYSKFIGRDKTNPKLVVFTCLLHKKVIKTILKK